MMGTERQVIAKAYRQNRDQTLFYTYDYAQLEIGDWFLLKGRSRIRSFHRSKGRNPIGVHMAFVEAMVDESTMRVTRIA